MPLLVQTMVEVFVSGVKQPMLKHWLAERSELSNSHGFKECSYR